MTKFRRPEDYRETAVDGPEESGNPERGEYATAGPEETPAIHPSHICGVNGCNTVYRDSVVMRKHRQRMHGIGDQGNLNQPKPRNPNPKWV